MTSGWKSGRGMPLMLVLLAATACRGPQEPNGEDIADLPADMIMVNMVQNMTESGMKRATLRGDTAYIYEDSSMVHVKKVDLTIFDQGGKQNAHLTSATGDFNTASQGMIARGNVILVTVQGNKRIETAELHYDPTTHKLWSNVETVMVEGGSRIVGDGFTADDQFQNVQVIRPRGRASGLKIEF